MRLINLRFIFKHHLLRNNNEIASILNISFKNLVLTKSIWGHSDQHSNFREMKQMQKGEIKANYFYMYKKCDISCIV